MDTPCKIYFECVKCRRQGEAFFVGLSVLQLTQLFHGWIPRSGQLHADPSPRFCGHCSYSAPLFIMRAVIWSRAIGAFVNVSAECLAPAVPQPQPQPRLE
ncbi:unnamed protein product [Ceutorhynchus assimilis]|uniref:Uncharacterized protein n=1 Tax=Ceutorhynchus assimilis TaxID=467358 RepID=A0A9N9QSC7_9CUCU|nr:unnamed protein product [Ceutorhynchus assimilis]